MICESNIAAVNIMIAMIQGRLDDSTVMVKIKIVTSASPNILVVYHRAVLKADRAVPKYTTMPRTMKSQPSIRFV
jgi:hypothetical protein